MNRFIRFIIVFIAALALVPFLPLYIERTMLRSWQVGQSPDIIEWGWKLGTLPSYWSDYKYLAPEQQPALWLVVNLALVVLYALVIAFVIDKVFARRVRGTRRGDKSLN